MKTTQNRTQRKYTNERNRTDMRQHERSRTDPFHLMVS